MKIIDMSQPLFHACPGWPSYKAPMITRETVVGVNGYTSERLDINTHTGTHLDAPLHFYPELASIDRIPIEKFIGEAVIINLTGVPACHGIDIKDMEPYADKIGKDSIVLLCTGWSKKRGYTKEYYNDWPFLTAEGAQWLYEKGIKGVGIDGMSIGGWHGEFGRPPHEVLLSHGIWILEEVNFPDEVLKYDKVMLHAVPIKLRDCGGSPCRAYAVVPD